MMRKDISYDSEETDVEELQRMVADLTDLIDDAESRVNDIVSNLESVNINSMDSIESAYEVAKELSTALY